MDFQGEHDFDPNNALGLLRSPSQMAASDPLTSMKLQRLMSAKDLSNKNYAQQLILLMDVKFSNDAFLEAEYTKKMLNVDNIFLIPREVKYDDYIN